MRIHYNIKTHFLVCRNIIIFYCNPRAQWYIFPIFLQVFKFHCSGNWSTDRQWDMQRHFTPQAKQVGIQFGLLM